MKLIDAMPLAVFNLDAVSAHIISDGFFDRELLESLADELLNLNTQLHTTMLIDIGANIGNHSVYLSRYFNRVVAFEPHPRTYKLLEANAILSSNIECRNLALGSSRSTLNITTNPYNMGRNKISSSNNNSNAIEVHTLDEFFEYFKDPIGLIKIDVEGYEVEVLKGSKKVLKLLSPPIVLEVLQSEISKGRAESIDFLRKNGYNTFKIIKPKNNKNLISKYFGKHKDIPYNKSNLIDPENLPCKEIPMLLALKL